ncbi:alpha/beta fold hydrolase [Hyphococcus luteus]|uniref:2-hydroxy-6-oxo-2,4-heptadienoate hydrolase n=1 Tax=Hyphococcus luteus TaxID=2058213 RepID=A0A2S7K4F2_9PROT|nr:alpha/beta hydrolase [Marinicaulis flavus]PQA87382.1 2-hydroxy-6-oxo-2,4-heptadienoate hydrolase [Marinicaulis flavus]
MSDNPEIGKSVDAGGVKTNYHDLGEGRPVILIHGSGPGVTAWANWRLNLPALSESMRAIAPDMLGFGYTERPADGVYTMERWRGHLMDFADALDLREFDIIGNSFGGALALSMAVHHPDRIRRMVLMGAAGLEFELTEALDKVWGYEPSVEAMRKMLDIFAYDNSLVSDELAEMRYRASIQPGFHEAFSAMFPAPRQQHITALATPEDEIAKIACPTLILHGREDRVLPMSNSLRLFDLIKTSEVHLFGKCGHWTQIEHKDRFNLLVSDFLVRE